MAVNSNEWRLAAHGVMLRDVDVQAWAALASARGYDGLFWEAGSAARAGDALEPARRSAAASHLSVSGVGFAADEPNALSPQDAVELARAVGAPTVCITSASMRGRSYAGAYEATLELCEAYRAAAQPVGMRVLLHQRWGTITASASQLLSVLERFDPRAVGCVYDAGSMTIEGFEDYRIGLELLGEYVGDVHIANTRHFPSATRTVWEWEWSPLSDGLIDLQRLFRALRRADYRGWVTIADRSRGRTGQALLDADWNMVHQAMADYEGVGSHNPCRPLDDHVAREERPDRARVDDRVGAHA